jgi:hypothetical protein
MRLFLLGIILDYGPTVYGPPWFTSNTCYVSGCSVNNLADVWKNHWAFYQPSRDQSRVART